MNCLRIKRGILRLSIVDSNSGFTEQSKFLVRCENFYDPETASNSVATHVPSQLSTIPSPRTMRSRDSGLPRDARNTMGTSGNVFLKAYLLEKDDPLLSSTIQRIWHPLLMD